MFGASVSKLYLLIKLLINIEDSRSMCDHQKKYTCVHRNCESGLAIICKHAAQYVVPKRFLNMEGLCHPNIIIDPCFWNLSTAPHFHKGVPILMGERNTNPVPILPRKWGSGVPILGSPHFP